MRFDEAYSGNVFIRSHGNYEESQAVIYGMPMDWTVSFRPGSRFGPARIREVSIGLEEYSPYLDRLLEEVKYFDAGDIPLPFGNVEGSLDAIRSFVSKILADGKFPIGLGGEHLVTWPVIQAVYEKYKSDLVIFHFDAHTDLRDHYEGYAYSHSTPIKKACDLIGGKNVYSFGIRSGMKEEFEWAKENMHLYKYDVLEPVKQVLPTIGNRPIYLTIDIDVLDPAHAPGTGTTEAGGITSRELLETIHYMAKNGANVIGCDLVEVAPVYDHSEMTQIVASKIVRELILGFVK
ncbi:MULTISPECIES: agmatinase [Brevibacillus]|jgi:agmatinase|uniref:Agmatinase n=1 Tax=Brevibacillus thermoruber TaxID=33942 RepID=A0A9X3Z2W1_9BACL|nr:MULTISPECIES: agmatinase [Brevibacillus]MDA5108211.1 agmatinase [Brevibacillus thermoruber]TRY25789.1 agmatinase [Brevibacillus sp. LEMMJ03]UYZ13850.1 agmatinase [Brevibacillus sp. WF146]